MNIQKKICPRMDTRTGLNEKQIRLYGSGQCRTHDYKLGETNIG